MIQQSIDYHDPEPFVEDDEGFVVLYQYLKAKRKRGRIFSSLRSQDLYKEEKDEPDKNRQRMFSAPCSPKVIPSDETWSRKLKGGELKRIIDEKTFRMANEPEVFDKSRQLKEVFPEGEWKEPSVDVVGFIPPKYLNFEDELYKNEEAMTAYQEAIKATIAPLLGGQKPFDVNRVIDGVSNTLQEAFNVESEAHERLCVELENDFHIALNFKADLKRRLKLVDRHYYYVPESFPHKSDFQSWMKNEANTLHTMLLAASQRITKYQNKRPDRKNYWSLFFPCVCADIMDDGEEYRRIKALHYVEDRNYHETFVLLFLVLLKYQNPNCHFDGKLHFRHLNTLSSFDKIALQHYGIYYGISQQYRDLVYLQILTQNLSNGTTFFDQILELLEDLGDLSAGHRPRDRIQMPQKPAGLDSNVNELETSMDYSIELSAQSSLLTEGELYDTKSESDEQPHQFLTPWTHSETRLFKKCLDSLLSWCAQCLKNYHEVFNLKSHRYAKEALRSCLKVLKRCHALKRGFASKEQEVKYDDEKDFEPRDETNYKSMKELINLVKSFIQVEPRYKQLVYQSKDSLPDPVRETVERSSSLTEIHIDGGANKIYSCDHMITIFVNVKRALQDDFETYSIPFREELQDVNSVTSFLLHQHTGIQYFDSIWVDAQYFLRSIASRGSDDSKQAARDLPPFIFQLYEVMKDFYYFLLRDIKPKELPPLVSLQNQFQPFVQLWMDNWLKTFKFDYISRAIASDEWKFQDPDTLHSTSIVDVFSFLYPLSEQFKALPYSNQHLLSFTNLVSTVIIRYVKSVDAMIKEDIQGETEKKYTWGYDRDSRLKEPILNIPQQMLVRINNIEICQEKLNTLLEKINILDQFGHAPNLGRESQIKRTNEEAAADYEEDFVKLNLADALECNDTFVYMKGCLSNISDSISSGMVVFYDGQLKSLIWLEPYDKEYSVLEMDKLLNPVWVDLQDKLDIFEKSLYIQTFERLLRDLLKHIAEIFETMLVEHRRVLSKAQIKRIEHAIKLIVEVFQTYGIPKAYLNSIQGLKRVEYLRNLLLSPTSNLIHVWRKIETAPTSEKERKRQEPYIYIETIFAILRWRRAKERDVVAAQFINDNPHADSGVIDRLKDKLLR